MTKVDLFDDIFGIPKGAPCEARKAAECYIVEFCGVTLFTSRERLAELYAVIGAALAANEAGGDNV